METIAMSSKEISRLEVMQKLEEKRLSQKEASAMLGVGVRQIKRLLKLYRQEGAKGLVSKHRGRKENNRLDEKVLSKALELMKGKYKGFGPTLAQEKLVEKEKLNISVESVRQLMIGEGLWKARKAKKAVVHQLRERRASVGELVQIDGSPHAWFEGRGEPCVLLVFIDDASGKLQQLHFAVNESFFSYSEAARSYFEQHGKPVAFYSDKHGIFRVNQPSTGAGEALTQFGRAMQDLDIQIICANTPQAKGRVERVIQTLQDRLVKELRLRGKSTMTDGNAYLPEFMADFNQRFAVEPRSSSNAHRALTPKDDLNTILTWQETRTISKNLTVQFEKVVYQIQTDRPSYALRNASVTMCVNAQQQVTILYKGKSLPYEIFHQQTKQAEVVTAKDVDAALKKRVPVKPAPDHPWRHASTFKNRANVPAPRGGDISILDNG
ncbi:MAG: ISNCY family transposase [Anaerolineales bacterium]|nr:ISNCY family transposase [Anaerolineales bacterium]